MGQIPRAYGWLFFMVFISGWPASCGEIPEASGFGKFRLKAYVAPAVPKADNESSTSVPTKTLGKKVEENATVVANYTTDNKIKTTEQLQLLHFPTSVALTTHNETDQLPTLTAESMEEIGRNSFRVEQWLTELEKSGYNYANPPGTMLNTIRQTESPSTIEIISPEFGSRTHISPTLNRLDTTKLQSPILSFGYGPMDGINIRVSCNMNLRSYPLDAQACFLKILPYGNNASKVVLKWLGDNPIQVNEEIHEADLELIGWKTETFTATYYNSDYTCLKAIFFLRRTIGQSFLQVYAPTISIVMISWISFWIDPTSVPGRTGLCVTTLLTLSTQAAGISFRLPPVGYAKALDVWLSVCMLFLFGSLIEFTVVNTYTRKWMHYSTADKSTTRKTSNVWSTGNGCPPASANPNFLDPPTLVLNQDGELINFTEEKSKAELCAYYKAKALQIDKISRIGFPVFFSIFVIIYMIVYTIGRRTDPMKE